MGPDDRGGRRAADYEEAAADPRHLNFGHVDDLGYNRFAPRWRHRSRLHLRALRHAEQNVRSTLARNHFYRGKKIEFLALDYKNSEFQRQKKTLENNSCKRKDGERERDDKLKTTRKRYSNNVTFSFWSIVTLGVIHVYTLGE